MSTDPSQYDEAYNETLGEKLRVLEQLRPLLAKESIHCPGEEAINLNTLVLIGDQATGKTSVLEGITGIMLPQTVTRMPIVLHLEVNSQINQNSISIARHADFRDARNCQNMNELQQVLQGAAEEVQQSGVPVANTPVHVRYLRKTGPALTLVDLPGICYFCPVKEYDIAKATVSMVEEYAGQEHMIMLVVCHATGDFGTRAVQIAQHYDNDALRTIGVATHVDTLETDSSYFLQQMRMEGEDTPSLKHGFIAIQNRLKREEKDEGEDFENILSTHPLLAQLDWSEKGFKALAKRIVHAQSKRVDDFIISAKKEIESKISKFDEDLKAGSDIIQKQEHEIRGVNDEIQKKKGLLEDVSDEVQRTSGELKTINDDIHSSESRLAINNDEVHEVEKRLEKTEDQIVLKSNQVIDVGNKLDVIKGELQGVEDRIRREEGEMRNVDGQVEAIERETSRILPNEESTEVLGAGIDFVRSKFKQVKITFSRTAHRKEEEKMRRLSERVEALEANLNELMNAKEKISKNLIEAREAEDRLQNTLEETKEELRQVTEDKEKLETVKAEIGVKLMKLREEREKILEKLKGAREERDSKKNSYDLSQARKWELQNVIKELEDKLEKLQQEHEKAKDQEKERKKRQNLLKDHLRRLESLSCLE